MTGRIFAIGRAIKAEDPTAKVRVSTFHVLRARVPLLPCLPCQPSLPVFQKANRQCVCPLAHGLPALPMLQVSYNPIPIPGFFIPYKNGTPQCYTLVQYCRPPADVAKEVLAK